MQTHAASLPVTVNYHINKNCNFRCKACYAVFDDSPLARGVMLDRKSMFAIVDAVAGATPLPGGRRRKLTFAGGEPTLCPWLPEMIAHAKASGLVTMLVTNGSRCDEVYLQRLAHCLDWLTVSIDSLDATTNAKIGRMNSKGETLSAGQYEEILRLATSNGISTKINTVVSRLNLEEDMNDFIAHSGIQRWKVLQVMGVEGQNDTHFQSVEIPREEFDRFIDRHSPIAASGLPLVAEPATSIRGSYCMIDPSGRFFDSASGSHTYSRPILNLGIDEAFRDVSFDPQLFMDRGGSYDFQA